MTNRVLAAEFLGTFALVLGGCGTAMFTGPAATGGIVAVSIAFGLTVLMMAYAVGHISGGHFNPAVTLGLVAGGRFPGGQAMGYIAAQVVGGLAAAAVLSAIYAGAPAGAKLNSMAAISNGFGGPTGYSLGAAFLTEMVLTALFVIVIMGATSKKAPAGFAPIAIGLALTLIHLVSIPITNTSVNPARSLAPAVFAMGVPMSNVWLFWVAPIIGGIIGGAISKWLQNE